MTMLQIYQILQVQPGADIDIVKKSFRKLVKKHHPDVSTQANSSRKFNLIMSAFEEYKEKYKSPPIKAKTKNKDIFSAKFKKIHALYILGNSFLQEKDPLKRIEIIKKLVLTKKISAYTFIRKGLWDENLKVVEQAILAIMKMNIAQSSAELTALYLRSSKKIRLLILDSLEKMENIKAFSNLLIAAMKDTHKGLKKRAVILFTKRFFN